MLEYQIVFPDQTVMDISIPSDSDILQRACAFFDKEDFNAKIAREFYRRIL